MPSIPAEWSDVVNAPEIDYRKFRTRQYASVKGCTIKKTPYGYEVHWKDGSWKVIKRYKTKSELIDALRGF